MQNQTLTSDHEIKKLLIERYKQRAKIVYKYPSPYYGKALWEKSEILNKVKELEKIDKKS